MILVIENFCNGYLDYYLEKNSSSSWSSARVKREKNLPWEKRLQICIDVARALNYLHCEKSSKNTSSNKKIILNRDIGRHTIGLDENWRAKIIEFGFSVFLPSDVRIEGLYSKNRGRVCYTDPYDTVRFLRAEADVYSFGVVMYEILCGRIADSPIYLRKSEKGLAHVANQAYSKGKLEKMIDPLIHKHIGQKNFDRPLFEFDCLAGCCVSATVILRPSMEEVVMQLESQLQNALRVRLLFSEVSVLIYILHTT
ncbi:putative protein kinase RLK-Pelle-WAK family [Helianthus annuus]|nr:putative protein kinase RLK-Pelle-WAK family [Helianthus annuus]